MYVREAHPTDGWRMSSNDQAGIAFAQPRANADRSKIASQCCGVLEIAMPMVVDSLHDPVGHAYSGMPDRLYLLDGQGRVVFKSGRGPFGFRPGELEQSMIMHQMETTAPAPR